MLVSIALASEIRLSALIFFVSALVYLLAVLVLYQFLFQNVRFSRHLTLCQNALFFSELLSGIQKFAGCNRHCGSRGAVRSCQQQQCVKQGKKFERTHCKTVFSDQGLLDATSERKSLLITKLERSSPAPRADFSFKLFHTLHLSRIASQVSTSIRLTSKALENNLLSFSASKAWITCYPCVSSHPSQHSSPLI